MGKDKTARILPLTKCGTTDELADALKQKAPFIEITDELKRDFFRNIKEQVENDSLGQIGTAVAVGLASPKAFMETFALGLGAGDAGVILAICYGVARLYVGAVGILGNLLTGNTYQYHYEFAVFGEENTTRFLLVRKKTEKDSMIVCEGLADYGFVLDDEDHCPACGKKIVNLKGIKKEGFNPYACAECGQKFIWSVDLERFAKEELNEERARLKKLKSYGIRDEGYSTPGEDELSSLSKGGFVLQRQNIASEDKEALCKAFRQELKANKFIPEPFIDKDEGEFYRVVKAFFEAQFDTPDAEVAILDMARFINIRTRQIRNVPNDRSEKTNTKYIIQSYHLGKPAKIKGKYENALKEAAWISVMSYLCDVFLSAEKISMMIPKDAELFAKWNGFIEAIPYAPQEIKDLFTLDSNGSCGFLLEYTAK